MTTFFDPLTAGSITLQNRIIMAPMTRGRADDDGNQAHIAAEYYAQRASAGLIISEAVNISPLTKANDNTPGIYTLAQIDSWKAVTSAVHEKGGKIFMQLYHTGRLSLPEMLPGGAQPVSASAVTAKWQNFTRSGLKDLVMPAALTTDGIRQTIRDFATAAGNAISAGFDGVELHAAYGYLIHQFLGTNSNIRTDEYGGSLENRARFLFETLDAVASVIGAGRTGIRLSPGVPLHDMEENDAATLYPYLADALSSRHLAYLHVALGPVPATDVDWHQLLRPAYRGVYFANGGFTKSSGEALLAANGADAIVYGKLFLANPDLPERFRQDAVLNVPNPTTFYTPGEVGYTDYPRMEQVVTA